MAQDTVGVFFDPWPRDWVHGQTRVGVGSLPERYRRTVWLKANPRREEYLRALFAERYPEGRFVAVGDAAAGVRAAADAATVILLYPDAIGLGWSRIERRLAPRPGRVLRALTGRRRDFPLDRRTLAALRLRRFLEWTMLLELALLGPFLVATALLAAWDTLRGRR